MPATDPTVTIELNYPPEPVHRYGHGKPPNAAIQALYASKEASQRAFGRAIVRHAPSFLGIKSHEHEAGPGEPHWLQPWFPPSDGMSLMTALIEHRPATYLEIGSGNSTAFARWAIERHGLGTRIVSIDPAPRAGIDAICDELHREPLERVDLSVFGSVRAGDVVFLDGSHRVLQNSDVVVFFLEVLPSLPAGVVVGVHDIFWPNDYPPKWVGRYYSEQYLLGAYMLGLGERLDLLFATPFASKWVRDDLAAVFRDRPDVSGRFGGGAVWWRHGG